MADEVATPKPSGPGGKQEKGRPKRSFASRLPSARQVGFFLFGLMVAAAGAFWVWWGISFGVWIDNGIYAIVVTLAGFGLAGMLLTLPPRHRGIPA